MTPRAVDRPSVKLKGIHIPPEEAAFLVMLLLEAVGTVWQQERAKWSMRKLTMQRSLEYALAHENGFKTLLRQSRLKRW